MRGRRSFRRPLSRRHRLSASSPHPRLCTIPPTHLNTLPTHFQRHTEGWSGVNCPTNSRRLQARCGKAITTAPAWRTRRTRLRRRRRFPHAHKRMRQAGTLVGRVGGGGGDTWQPSCGAKRRGGEVVLWQPACGGTGWLALRDTASPPSLPRPPPPLSILCRGRCWRSLVVYRVQRTHAPTYTPPPRAGEHRLPKNRRRYGQAATHGHARTACIVAIAAHGGFGGRPRPPAGRGGGAHHLPIITSFTGRATDQRRQQHRSGEEWPRLCVARRVAAGPCPGSIQQTSTKIRRTINLSTVLRSRAPTSSWRKGREQVAGEPEWQGGQQPPAHWRGGQQPPNHGTARKLAGSNPAHLSTDLPRRMKRAGKQPQLTPTQGGGIGSLPVTRDAGHKEEQPVGQSPANMNTTRGQCE